MSIPYVKRFVGKRAAINPEEHKLLSPVYAVSKRLEANQRILVNLMGQLYTGGINQETLQQLRDISLDIHDDAECLLNDVHDLDLNCRDFPAEIPTTDKISQLKAQIELLQRQVRVRGVKGEEPVSPRQFSVVEVYPRLHDNNVIETYNRARIEGHVTKRNGHREMTGFGPRHMQNGDMYRASCSEIRRNTPVTRGTPVYDILGTKYKFMAINLKGEILVETMNGTQKLADGTRITAKMYLHPPFYISKEDAKQMRLS